MQFHEQRMKQLSRAVWEMVWGEGVEGRRTSGFNQGKMMQLHFQVFPQKRKRGCYLDKVK